MSKGILYGLLGVLGLGFILVYGQYKEEVMVLEKALKEEHRVDNTYKDKFNNALKKIDGLKAEVEKSEATLKLCEKEVITCSTVEYVDNALQVKR